jgi:hypothetical protein
LIKALQDYESKASNGRKKGRSPGDIQRVRYGCHNARPARSVIVAESSVHMEPFDTAVVGADDLTFPETVRELELGEEMPELEAVPVPGTELLLVIVVWPAVSVKEEQVMMNLSWLKSLLSTCCTKLTLFERREAMARLLVGLRLIERDPNRDNILEKRRNETQNLSCGDKPNDAHGTSI